MSVEKFEELLGMVGPKIQKESTWFREAVSARLELENHIAPSRHLISAIFVPCSKERNISFSAGGVVCDLQGTSVIHTDM
jgi:hypothetical protein